MDSLNDHLCLEELVAGCGPDSSGARAHVMTMHHLADSTPPASSSVVGDSGALPSSHHHSHGAPSGSSVSGHSSHVSHSSHASHSSHSSHTSHSSQQRGSLSSTGSSADPPADRSTGKLKVCLPGTVGLAHARAWLSKLVKSLTTYPSFSPPFSLSSAPYMLRDSVRVGLSDISSTFLTEDTHTPQGRTDVATAGS